MMGSNMSKAVCNTTDQIKYVLTMVGKFREMNESEAYQTTGCLSSCNKV